MARVQLIVPDNDHLRYVQQAQRESLSLSAWLRAAAEDRLRRKREARRFESVAELEAFYAECDRLPGPDREPDWEEHLATINQSRSARGDNS